MATIIELILNATFTGIGVTLGAEIYDWLKNRRKKIKERVNGFYNQDYKK